MAQKLEQLIKKSEEIHLKKQDIDTQVMDINQNYTNIRNEILSELKSVYTNETDQLKQDIDKLNTKMTIVENIVKLADARNFEDAVTKHREYTQSNKPSLSTIISLDKTAYENEAHKTQDQWIAAGKDFASAADYYKAFKEIKNAIENGNAEDKNYATELMDNLRNEWSNRWSVTSTRIRYDKDLEGTITQHYGSKNKDKIKETQIEIPVYEGVQIEKVLKDKNKKGLKFIQTLLETEDDADTIIETLKDISGKDTNRLYVHTPNKDSRKENKERPVLLGNYDSFIIYCYDSLSYDGCARGGA